MLLSHPPLKHIGVGKNLKANNAFTYVLAIKGPKTSAIETLRCLQKLESSGAFIYVLAFKGPETSAIKTNRREQKFKGQQCFHIRH